MSRSLNWSLTIALVLGFQIAIAALADIVELGRADSAPILGDELTLPLRELSTAARQELLLARHSGYYTALLLVRPVRPYVSTLLAVAAFFLFVSAIRFRLNTEYRASFSKNIAHSALLTAILRTVDGAVSLAMTRTLALEQSAIFRRYQYEAEASALELTATTINILWSGLMVAVLTGLWTYFNSSTLLEQLRR